MQLILDFGNTNQKAALFAGNGNLISVVSHEHLTLSDLRNIVDENPRIESSIISAVVEVPGEIPAFLSSRFRLLEMNELTPVPLPNLYKTRSTMGSDRLAAAVAGWSQFKGRSVLVINMGTAITYDLVTDKGGYLGGAISPGMNMRFRSLHNFTSQLPLLNYIPIGFLTGQDTKGSVLSGVINGMAAEIEGMARAYENENPGLQVILSGGDLNNFVNRLKISIFAYPNIVIFGLQQILEFNDKIPL